MDLLTDLNESVLAAGDASSTRTVYGVIVLLGLIGIALVILAVWLIKQTRPEPQLLAPLERMDDRAWRLQNPAQMRRDLDSLRPAGAKPVVREKGVPAFDADFGQSRPKLATFDDLQAQLAADAFAAGPKADPVAVPRPATDVSPAPEIESLADDEIPAAVEASADVETVADPESSADDV